MIVVEARREAHDRDVDRALMIAAMQRTKEPGDLAKKLYVAPRRRRRPRPQTPEETRAVVEVLAARFGWKGRPHTAKVIGE